MKKNISFDQIASPLTVNAENGSGTKRKQNGESSEKVETKPEMPEVFLGGSCNPTTWRADVAIPALTQLGISFYNPVS